jgi:cytoskeleton protein RodZ
MLMSQLNPTGSRRIVSGRTPLSLVIGNAANVRLTYNDKPVDLKPYIQIEVARLTLN